MRVANFIQLPFLVYLGTGCISAGAFGFCLDRIPGMAFAKTLDPDGNTTGRTDSISNRLAQAVAVC